jgi:hypothetical protein
MKKRTFGDVLAEVIDGEGGIFLHAKPNLSLRAAEDLMDNIKSATAWIRDQQRPKVEDETPELPL